MKYPSRIRTKEELEVIKKEAERALHSLDVLRKDPIEFTCDKCSCACHCDYAYDAYNTNGDCLALK